jgi:hypothetical protein
MQSSLLVTGSLALEDKGFSLQLLFSDLQQDQLRRRRRHKEEEGEEEEEPIKEAEFWLSGRTLFPLHFQTEVNSLLIRVNKIALILSLVMRDGAAQFRT